jgi:uncharacterized protein
VRGRSWRGIQWRACEAVAWYFIRRFAPRQDTRKVAGLIRENFFWPCLAAGMLFVLASAPAQGARVPGLYQAEVEYEGDRNAGFRAALAVVLVRITGRRDAAERPEARPLFADASAFAQQFREPAPGRLWAAFDGAALERELARLGLPVWGAERPSTLLWIAIDAAGGRRFVVAASPEQEEEVEVHEAVAAAAERRGIPVVFPLLDAEDRAQASFAEVWGGFEEAIRAASERYAVDAILVGRLSAEDGGRGRWSLYTAEGEERWTGELVESIDRVADLHAARFSVVASGEARVVRLVVSGVASVEDYGRVSRFLGGLTAVESLGVERVEGERITFRVAMRGEAATLDEAIRLGGLLRPDSGRDGELSYRIPR